MRFLPVERFDSTYLINFDNLDWAANNNACGCSFNVLGARLLNLSYPDYLKFLRASGGELRGKTGYSYAIFKNKEDCQKICNLLNKEWKKIEKIL